MSDLERWLNERDERVRRIHNDEPTSSQREAWGLWIRQCFAGALSRLEVGRYTGDRYTQTTAALQDAAMQARINDLDPAIRTALNGEESARKMLESIGGEEEIAEARKSYQARAAARRAPR